MSAEWRQQLELEEEHYLLEQEMNLKCSTKPKLKLETKMPNINEMMPSKYLKKEDFINPKVMTISGVQQENVAMDNQPPEVKWVCHFHETNKPLVLNSTNLQLIAKSLNQDNSDHWANKQITLFNDPNVSFGGQLTGGIRVQIPTPQNFNQPQNQGQQQNQQQNYQQSYQDNHTPQSENPGNGFNNQ